MAQYYSDFVMEHFTNPRNVGELEDANGVGEIGNAKCGDIMKMYIKVEGDRIVDIKFKTFGCGSAIATSSIATEMIKGKTIEEALKLTNKAVVEALGGLPAHKIHCSVLAEQAIKAAIADYYKRQGIDPTARASTPSTGVNPTTSSRSDAAQNASSARATSGSAAIAISPPSPGGLTVGRCLSINVRFRHQHRAWG